MKFTLIGPVYPFRGGISHFTTELAKTMRKKHDVQVISFERQYPQWLYPGESDRDPSQQANQIDAEYLLDSLNPLSWRQVAHKVRASSPDAVIMQWWTTFFAPMNIVIGHALRRAGIPLIYVVHNTLPHETRPWDMHLTRYTLGRADHLLALSQGEQNRLRNLFPNKSISYAPHPVYNLFPTKNLSRQNARKQLNLPLSAPIILFFGLVRPYKGLQVLLESFVQLRKSIPNAHLVIAGEFWESKSPYQDYIKKTGVENYVTLHATYIPNEQVAAYFIAADAFAAPYLTTSQSGAIKTAMGFGLPIAVSEIAVDTSDVPPDYPIFTVPANNPRSFATALDKALQTPRINKLQPAQATWDNLNLVLESLTQTTR